MVTCYACDQLTTKITSKELGGSHSDVEQLYVELTAHLEVAKQRQMLNFNIEASE